jgi:hypothetical protein
MAVGQYAWRPDLWGKLLVEFGSLKVSTISAGEAVAIAQLASVNDGRAGSSVHTN